jgi:hypothetical protein
MRTPRRHPGQLDRRAMLKGLGVAMSLPWLEAMLPNTLVRAGSVARASAPLASPLRMAFLFIPNGVDPAGWQPKGEGRDYELSPALAPLAEHRDHFSVLRGLAHRNAKALGDGPGDHARSAACFLTGAHPYKTAGRDIRVGISVDQLAAQAIGSRTLLPSLELGCEPALQSGNCDSGYSCAYSANMSWRTATQPNLKEIRPREVFERLFGINRPGESGGERDRRLAARKSILDYVRGDARRLNESLGSSDRMRMEEYTEGVRALERRIESLERATRDPGEFAAIEPAEGVPADYREHVELMNDMLVLAFRLDQTRISTFMLANEGSNRSFPFLGVKEGHHHISHHKGDEGMIEGIQAINRFQSEMLADLLTKMRAVEEPDGTLLDNSMIVYGSAICDGNRHNHEDLPVILAGGGGGTLDPGRHVSWSKGTPLSNLFVSMLQRMDIDVDVFADSTGPLKGI